MNSDVAQIAGCKNTIIIVIFGVFCTNNMFHHKKVGMHTFKRLWGQAVKKNV